MPLFLSMFPYKYEENTRSALESSISGSKRENTVNNRHKNVHSVFSSSLNYDPLSSLVNQVVDFILTVTM